MPPTPLIKWRNRIIRCRHHILSFTLVEMLVVVSIIAILAALLMPGLQNTLRTTRALICQNNLRQAGQAISLYGHDNNGFFPRYFNSQNSTIWCAKGGSLIPVYISADDERILYGLNRNTSAIVEEFACPSDSLMFEYAMNWYLSPSGNPTKKLSMVRMPSRMFAITDYITYFAASSMSDQINRYRHPNYTTNYLYCDGHIESISITTSPWSTGLLWSSY